MLQITYFALQLSDANQTFLPTLSNLSALHSSLFTSNPRNPKAFKIHPHANKLFQTYLNQLISDCKCSQHYSKFTHIVRESTSGSWTPNLFSSKMHSISSFVGATVAFDLFPFPCFLSSRRFALTLGLPSTL